MPLNLPSGLHLLPCREEVGLEEGNYLVFLAVGQFVRLRNLPHATTTSPALQARTGGPLASSDQSRRRGVRLQNASSPLAGLGRFTT